MVSASMRPCKWCVVSQAFNDRVLQALLSGGHLSGLRAPTASATPPVCFTLLHSRHLLASRNEAVPMSFCVWTGGDRKLDEAAAGEDSKGG